MLLRFVTISEERGTLYRKTVFRLRDRVYPILNGVSIHGAIAGVYPPQTQDLSQRTA